MLIHSYSNRDTKVEFIYPAQYPCHHPGVGGHFVWWCVSKDSGFILEHHGMYGYMDLAILFSMFMFYDECV